MFDIGFWELAVLGIIALIVLGPERLPVVARTMGRWVARAKGYMNAITSELEREVKADEIRKEVQLAREQIESETRNVHSETRKSVEPVMKPLEERKPTAKPSTAQPAQEGAVKAASPASDTPTELNKDAAASQPAADEPSAGQDRGQHDNKHNAP